MCFYHVVYVVITNGSTSLSISMCTSFYFECCQTLCFCFFVFLLLLPKYCSNKISSNDEWIWLVFFYILWVQKTKTLCFTFVSERTSLSHVCEEFCQIWYKCPLWLVDELIRIWWSKVRGQAHCDITFIPICVYNKQV